MESLLISLLVIFAGIVITPPLARRVGLPVIAIVAELVYGIVLGVSFLNLVPYDEPTHEFFASFGLVYLMFVVGLEVDFGAIYREDDLRKVTAVAGTSLVIAFAAGAGVSCVANVHPLPIFSNLSYITVTMGI